MAADDRLGPQAMAVLDALGEGITIHDAEGRMIAANRAAEEILRLEPSELLSRAYDDPDWRISTPDGRPVYPGELPAARAIEDGHPVRGEEIVVDRPDAPPVVLSVNAVPIFDDEGRVEIAIISFRDVTEQHELESRLRKREQEYETLLTEISDVVTVLDEEGAIRYLSPSVERVFGHPPAELEGRPVVELVHPDDADRVADEFLEAVARREPTTVQYRFRHADGSWRLVESTGVVPDVEGLETVVVTRDITARVEAEQKYRTMFSMNPSAVGLATLEGGRFVEVNQAFEDLLGHPRDDVIGATAGELGVWARPSERDRVVERIRESGAVHNLEVEFRDAGGEVIDVLFSGSALEIGDRSYLVGVAQDITDRKKFEEALERQALHDQLTGLPNRTLFHDRLEHALERADRTGTRVAVLFLDLDRFKAVNDSLGHPAGDRVLRSVAGRLTHILREEDTVARVGGDEFAVLLEDLDAVSDIEGAVARIRRIFRTPFEVQSTTFELSASIGIAHDGLGFGTPDELVRLADAAMYRVKQPGSTDFHIFQPEQDQQVTERLQREAALEAAVKDEQFVVHYQPIYRLEPRGIVGAEALVRWRDPDRGLVHPGDFIPLAEETGLIVPMGRQVLDRALRQYRRWRDAGVLPEGSFRVSVNLSARQHEEPDLVDRIAAAADDAGVPLSGLMLEITETVAMTGPDRFRPLREEGAGIAIDDFGTGYSSLDYLRHFAADVLKLDRSFVTHLGERDHTAALVQGILDVARRMEMGVVAEGIETERQLDLLLDFGCRYGQGFLFARPMPADDFARLLRGQEK
jgi:diguanylate cyclase (GGDEF)-like protein/PAS domain S-box-containing protein